MNTFTNLGVAPQLLTALEHLQITTPTPVQEQAIPQALQGLDLLVSAQTGTGKTYAYLLPVITRLLAMPKANALIIAPTRELALQIQQNLNKVNTKAIQMRTAMLIGGQAMGPQFGDLRRNPRIVIGTPGRINDHLERGSLILQDTSVLIVDEFDRMLDMGFERQLETIRAELPEVRQTLLFSATMPHNVVRMVQNYTQNPVRITVGTENTATLNVKQEIVKTSMADKFTQLLKELEAREGSAIIFVRTQRKTEELSEKLEGVNAKEFLNTVNAYNANVNHDVKFNHTVLDGKGTENIYPPKTNWAQALDTGPFEAYQTTCGITFTFGGLRTVADSGQVLNVHLKPIEGLYCAGEMVGGIFYFNYPSGTGLVSGSIFGRIAGTSAGKAALEN